MRTGKTKEVADWQICMNAWKNVIFSSYFYTRVMFLISLTPRETLQ